MKRIKSFTSLAVISALIFTVIACSTNINDTQPETETQKNSAIDGKTGSASFNLVIPDYYAMAGLKNNSRAVAAQTTKLKLSYQNKTTKEWIVHSTLDLSEAEKTTIPNAPEGFVGSAYKCTFVNIPYGYYVSGTMKIELLDSEDNVISSGTNNDLLHIIPDKTTHATFYTIPTSSNASSSSLAAGEMKFLKHEFDSRYDSAVSISVEEGKPYPDLVVFNEDGSFCKYIQVSADNNYIDCSAYRSEDGGTTKYLGFWSASATSYSATIGFNYKNAFSNMGQDGRDWKISCSQNDSVTSYNNGFKVDGTEDNARIWRTVYLDQPKILSFLVLTNLNEIYDGSLQFLIDDVVMGTYTGVNRFWGKEVFEISEGIHTIEWRRNDLSSTSTDGIGTLFASVSSCAFAEPIQVQAMESINQDFESDLDTNMWIRRGLGTYVLERDPMIYSSTHGKIFKLTTYESYYIGNSSLSFKVVVSGEKCLSFDYRCNLPYYTYFRIYIDDSEIPIFEKTKSNSDDNTNPYLWERSFIKLTEGIHSVKFSAEKAYDDDGNYYTGDDVVYLDNIVLEDIVEPEILSLDIPVATYTKEGGTAAATITGQNFDSLYIDLSAFSATCPEDPDIVSDATFKVKNDTTLEVLLKIPIKTGNYNITINYKTDSVTGVLKVKPLEEVPDDFLKSENWVYNSPFSINEENGVSTDELAGKLNSGIIKRSLVLNQSKVFSFKVETNLYEKGDGSLQFLIDDVVMATYSGVNSVWENEMFEMESGVHTIEWKREDINNGSVYGIEQFTRITNIAFIDPIQAIESMNQDFESELDSNMYIGGGFLASVVSDDNSNHGKVYKLGVYNGSYPGNSYLKIYKISLTQEKTLYFDYNCDLVFNANEGTIKDYLRVYIDDSETPAFEATGPKGWNTGTVTIPAGIHSVKFSSEKTYDTDGTYWYNSGANAAFLDNIILES